MEPKRRHCIGDCDFAAYYDHQVGRGINDIVFYRGRPFQRGYGFGSVFRKIGVPMLKFLGKHILPVGVGVGSDLINKRPLRESLRERGAAFVKNAGRDGADKLASYISQQGSGRKRKRVYKRRKTVRKVKRKRKTRTRDIFNGLSS